LDVASAARDFSRLHIQRHRFLQQKTTESIRASLEPLYSSRLQFPLHIQRLRFLLQKATESVRASLKPLRQCTTSVRVSKPILSESMKRACPERTTEVEFWVLESRLPQPSRPPGSSPCSALVGNVRKCSWERKRKLEGLG
jgi:hypothetical protein